MANPLLREATGDATDLEHLVGEMEHRNAAREKQLGAEQRKLEEQERALRSQAMALHARIQVLHEQNGGQVGVDLGNELAELRIPTLHDEAYRLAVLHQRRQVAIAHGLALEALTEALGEFEHGLQLEHARAECVADKLAELAPAPAAPGAEQRRAVRVKVNTAVTLESESNVFTGFSIDLSDAGVFVATVDLLPRGERVQLAVDLPSGVRIEAVGEVRWVRDYNETRPMDFPGMGVQFINLTAEHKAALRAFLAQREPLFYAD